MADGQSVLPHCEYSEYPYEYSEYPCEYSEYRRGPGLVRMTDGQSCRAAAAVRRTTHVPPMRRAGVLAAIAPLNPQPQCRVEHSQRTACPQRRGHRGSAVRGATEWRGNKQNHTPAPPCQVTPGC